MNQCVRKDVNQHYRKPVDMETEGEESTTTPKVHFTDKHPITELQILLTAAEDKLNLFWILGWLWIKFIKKSFCFILIWLI